VVWKGPRDHSLTACACLTVLSAAFTTKYAPPKSSSAKGMVLHEYAPPSHLPAGVTPPRVVSVPGRGSSRSSGAETEGEGEGAGAGRRLSGGLRGSLRGTRVHPRMLQTSSQGSSGKGPPSRVGSKGGRNWRGGGVTSGWWRCAGLRDGSGWLGQSAAAPLALPECRPGAATSPRAGGSGE
jgi:hypothetical protein